MSKLLAAIDELNRGRQLVRAAYMAAHGANGLDSEEMNALTTVLGAAEAALEDVEARLDQILKEEPAQRPAPLQTPGARGYN